MEQLKLILDLDDNGRITIKSDDGRELVMESFELPVFDYSNEWGAKPMVVKVNVLVNPKEIKK